MFDKAFFESWEQGEGGPLQLGSSRREIHWQLLALLRLDTLRCGGSARRLDAVQARGTEHAKRCRSHGNDAGCIMGQFVPLAECGR
jgi:hypothetical protein